MLTGDPEPASRRRGIAPHPRKVRLGDVRKVCTGSVNPVSSDRRSRDNGTRNGVSRDLDTGNASTLRTWREWKRKKKHTQFGDVKVVSLNILPRTQIYMRRERFSFLTFFFVHKIGVNADFLRWDQREKKMLINFPTCLKTSLYIFIIQAWLYWISENVRHLFADTLLFSVCHWSGFVILNFFIITFI